MGEARGRNSRRYVRNNRALRDSLPPYCSWPPCLGLIDMHLPPTHPMSWTTDHTVALNEGGDLYGERTLMHRKCNSEKERARLEGRVVAAVDLPLVTSEEW